jgi:hypothetical protein
MLAAPDKMAILRWPFFMAGCAVDAARGNRSDARVDGMAGKKKGGHLAMAALL